MSLTLTVKAQPPARVWAAGLDPQRLRGLGVSQVSALSMPCGGCPVAVGDLFDITGSGDEQLLLDGDLRWIDGIGAGLADGRIVVEGPCGDHAGARMRGGQVEVRGDTGDWAGAEMAGGMLRVRGTAGARVGSAYPGVRAGMSGGEIVISGDVGEEAGAGLRRGLVAVGGRTGDGAGLRMLAGTVIALGGLGAGAGLGNKRGSLVSGHAVEPLPSYAFAVRFRPPALGLQLRRLSELGLSVDETRLRGRWARWSGDRTELGRGEILIFDEEEAGR